MCTSIDYIIGMITWRMLFVSVYLRLVCGLFRVALGLFQGGYFGVGGQTEEVKIKSTKAPQAPEDQGKLMVFPVIWVNK